MIRFPGWLFFQTVGFVLSLLTLPAHAAGRVECSSLKTTKVAGGQVGYCALLPPSYGPDGAKGAKFPVLYLLHGLGDNQESLINTGAWSEVEQLQEDKKIGEFAIITPNGGNSFYIDSNNGRVKYESFLVQEFIPAMERKYRVGGSRAARAISGVSMGGYGALRLAFKFPHMFSSVSAHSAALIERLPSGIGNVGASLSYIGPAFGTPPDAAYWQQNSPFAFARKSELKALKIYFDCGRNDEYGFDSGAESLDKLLTTRKIAHEFHIYPGGPGLEYFMRHFPASLEFHSKAFGLTK